MPKHNRSRLVDRELSQFASARYEGDVAGAWRALERAHILGQTVILLRTCVCYHLPCKLEIFAKLGDSFSDWP